MTSPHYFSIRQVVDLTGISELSLRGWENRYSAFQPKRNETGRRFYSKEDVERAILLRELIKRGHRIGQIAGLGNHRLKSIFEAENTLDVMGEQPEISPAVAQALEFMSLQRWAELEQSIRGFCNDKPELMIGDFFLPLMQGLAKYVREGKASIAQEHIFSSCVKEKIHSTLAGLSLIGAKKGNSRSLKFVLATPEGDFHEMGLLLAHLMVRSQGFSSLYLGCHTPARDLAETSLKFSATHVLIVSTISRRGGARREILSYANEVQKKIGHRTQILLAGSQAPLAGLDSRLIALKDFPDLLAFLKVRKTG